VTGTTLVVLPALNEADCVADVVRAVLAAGHDCLVVDDGSTDDTGAIARAAGADVIALPINLGVGGALRAGFRHAVDHGYRVVVQVDADGQHDPAQIDILLRSLDPEGGPPLDMVIGSRFAVGGDHAGMSWVRRVCVRAMSSTIRRTSGTCVSDPTSGFRAIRSPLLDAFAHDFPHHYLGDTFEAVFVAARRGYAIAEVPVSMRARQGGRPSADLYASVLSIVRAATVLLTGTTFDLPIKAGSR
jgi:glycosyltransferase involved in cell wall biosynthesis